MRYAPIHPPQFKNILATIYRALGQFERSAEVAKTAIAANPTDLIARLILASISVNQNDPATGALMTQEIHDLEPSFSIAKANSNLPVITIEPIITIPNHTENIPKEAGVNILAITMVPIIGMI